MGLTKRVKCRHCKRFFKPDHRNGNRQKYCKAPECRKASKAASQQKWLQKPENENYFTGPINTKHYCLGVHRGLNSKGLSVGAIRFMLIRCCCSLVVYGNKAFIVCYISNGHGTIPMVQMPGPLQPEKRTQ